MRGVVCGTHTCTGIKQVCIIILIRQNDFITITLFSPFFFEAPESRETFVGTSSNFVQSKKSTTRSASSAVTVSNPPKRYLHPCINLSLLLIILNVQHPITSKNLRHDDNNRSLLLIGDNALIGALSHDASNNARKKIFAPFATPFSMFIALLFPDVLVLCALLSLPRLFRTVGCSLVCL